MSERENPERLTRSELFNCFWRAENYSEEHFEPCRNAFTVGYILSTEEIEKLKAENERYRKALTEGKLYILERFGKAPYHMYFEWLRKALGEADE